MPSLEPSISKADAATVATCLERFLAAFRLTRPFRPQTNGIVERFNRRLAEAIAAKPAIAKNEGKNKFHTRAERDAFLASFVADCNRTRLKCLDCCCCCLLLHFTT